MKKHNVIATFTEIQNEYLDSNKCKLPFVLCTYGEYTFQHKIKRPEGYEFHHILWVTKGEGRFNVNGEEFVLSTGEGVFFKRGIPHGYQSTGDEFGTAWMTFTCIDGIFDYFKTPDMFRFELTPAFCDMTDEVRVLCTKGSTVFTRSAAGYSGLIKWFSEIGEPNVPKSVQIRRFMELHFSEPLTLDDIAKAVGLDRFALCRYYKNECKITVMNQLKHIRIEKAKKLLRHTQYRIEEIGVMCGFESSSYFGKLFKAYTGCTPNSYRKSLG